MMIHTRNGVLPAARKEGEELVESVVNASIKWSIDEGNVSEGQFYGALWKQLRDFGEAEHYGVATT